MNYTQLPDNDVAHMLSKIRADSIESLFSPIPKKLRLARALAIPQGVSELQLIRDTETLAHRNHGCDDLVCFLGGGAYDHFVPTLVDALSSGQSEFLTAYTPYQAEASQGLLQLFYEFQTMVCLLTGMEVANASMYEFASATAEAVMMAASITRRHRAVVSECVHADTLAVLQTYCDQRAIELVRVARRGGVTDEQTLGKAIDDKTAAVVVQSPNFFGCLERLDRIVPRIHECGALAIVATDPLTGGVLKTPGELDADIVVAEGQPLGIPLQYGGPYLGLLATRKQYLRKMPGRVVGMTQDQDGRRGFCLAMQTREQHIKRERASSNICTNQGLLAIRASVYMAALGAEGLREVAGQCFDKAHYAAERIAALDGYEPAFDAPFFKEFTVRTSRPVDEVIQKCRNRGILGGIALSRFADGLDDCILVAVTEKRTREEIDALVEALRSV
ncbi:MAG: aminomethyl-transferring glycine dehydrogenase subunit GcvPA [Phycisphaerae bacterium]